MSSACRDALLRSSRAWRARAGAAATMNAAAAPSTFHSVRQKVDGDQYNGRNAEQPREQILAHADLLGYAGMFGTLNDRGATLNRRNAEMPVGGVDGVFR